MTRPADPPPSPAASGAGSPRIGCWLVLLPLLLVAGACAPTVVALRAPALDREAAALLLVAAEAARAEAYARADPHPLVGLFADSAAAGLVPELARLRQRGEHVEERGVTRRLVHWAGAEGRGEGVLEVAGERRLVLGTGPPRTWSRIVRQWWSALGWTGGRWLVVRAADLPPEQWWRGGGWCPGTEGHRKVAARRRDQGSERAKKRAGLRPVNDWVEGPERRLGNAHGEATTGSGRVANSGSP